MKITKIVVAALIAGLLIIQFVGPSRLENRTENPRDILVSNEISENIQVTLRTACYDCHSMETNYPWYASVAPVSWFLYHHIEEGRGELNFSDWEDYPKRTKIRKLKELIEEVEEHKMPLKSYTAIHGDAELSEDQIKELAAWAESFSMKVLREE